MTGKNASFEIYFQAPDAGWQVMDVVDSRASAARMATAWLAKNPAHGVKVIRETFHPVRKAFLSLTVLLEYGPQAGVKFRDQRRDLACKETEDLMHPNARRIITASMTDWLERHEVTALEFLHRLDLVLAFKDAGTSMLAAQQHAAVALSEEYDADPQYYMRQIHKLSQAGLEEILREDREGRLIALDGNSVLHTAASLTERDDRRRALRTAIAHSMADLPSPAAKLHWLIGQAEAISEHRRSLEWACVILDQFLAENVAQGLSLNTIVPPDLNTIEALEHLATLTQGQAHGVSRATENGARLNRLYFKGQLTATRHALVCLCFDRLAAMRRTEGLALHEDLSALQSVFHRLSALPASLADPERLDDIRRRREMFLLNDNFIDECVRAEAAPLSGGFTLLRLSHHVQTEDGLAHLSNFVRGWLGSTDAEKLYTPLNRSMAFMARLEALAGLQRVISQSPFTAEDRDQMGEQVERLIGANLDQGRVIHRLLEKVGRDPAALLGLLQRASAGQLPSGAFRTQLLRELVRRIQAERGAFDESQWKEVQYHLCLMQERPDARSAAA